jgi:hypothetical protein
MVGKRQKALAKHQQPVLNHYLDIAPVAILPIALGVFIPNGDGGCGTCVKKP